jgi:hypothetical protein
MSQAILGSKMSDSVAQQLKPSKKLYGANGYGGASSDMPGEKPTTSGFLPQCDLASAHDNEWQKRTIDATPFPSAHGLAKRAVDEGSPGAAVPGKVSDNSANPVRKP